MSWNDIPDRTVEITEKDLVHILGCAMFYESRLPYGMVPPEVFRKLSRESEGVLAERRTEHERVRTAPVGLPENGFMHIIRCALFRDSYLDPGDLPPGIRDQLSPEAAELLDRWCEQAP